MTWFSVSVFYRFLINTGPQGVIQTSLYTQKLTACFLTRVCLTTILLGIMGTAEAALTNWLPGLLFHNIHYPPAHVVMVMAVPMEGRTWPRWECITGARHCVDTEPIYLHFKALSDPDTCLDYRAWSESVPCFTFHAAHCLWKFNSYFCLYILGWNGNIFWLYSVLLIDFCNWY